MYEIDVGQNARNMFLLLFVAGSYTDIPFENGADSRIVFNYGNCLSVRVSVCLSVCLLSLSLCDAHSLSVSLPLSP